MMDRLPAEMKKRQDLLNSIRANYTRYGFQEMETPIMEHIENLTSNQGGDNEKLIFKVQKRGEEFERAINSDNYDKFNEKLREFTHVETGIFGSDMKVEIYNDGPVTIYLDSDTLFKK